MQFKILQEFGRPQWIAILSALKRSTGLSVSELAEQLGMSYMGVKQHCVELKSRGYLDTWRRPKPVGRPEMVYRLTRKADPLFPQAGNDVSLEVLRTVSQIYGPNAPDRLLFGYFSRKTELYSKRVRGKTVAERAVSLAKLRNAEGYISECVYDARQGLRVMEYHSLLTELIEEFPNMAKMEAQMFEKLLGASVERTEERASGLKRTVFKVSTL